MDTVTTDSGLGGRKALDDRRSQLLRRKEDLGAVASYRRLEEHTGYSKGTIQPVLKGKETGLPIRRGRVLDKVEAALDTLADNQ